MLTCWGRAGADFPGCEVSQERDARGSHRCVDWRTVIHTYTRSLTHSHFHTQTHTHINPDPPTGVPLSSWMLVELHRRLLGPHSASLFSKFKNEMSMKVLLQAVEEYQVSSKKPSLRLSLSSPSMSFSPLPLPRFPVMSLPSNPFSQSRQGV